MLFNPYSFNSWLPFHNAYLVIPHLVKYSLIYLFIYSWDDVYCFGIQKMIFFDAWLLCASSLLARE